MSLVGGGGSGTCNNDRLREKHQGVLQGTLARTRGDPLNPGRRRWASVGAFMHSSFRLHAPLKEDVDRLRIFFLLVSMMDWQGMRTSATLMEGGYGFMSRKATLSFCLPECTTASHLTTIITSRSPAVPDLHDLSIYFNHLSAHMHNGRNSKFYHWRLFNSLTTSESSFDSSAAIMPILL